MISFALTELVWNSNFFLHLANHNDDWCTHIHLQLCFDSDGMILIFFCIKICWVLFQKKSNNFKHIVKTCFVSFTLIHRNTNKMRATWLSHSPSLAFEQWNVLEETVTQNFRARKNIQCMCIHSQLNPAWIVTSKSFDVLSLFKLWITSNHNEFFTGHWWITQFLLIWPSFPFAKTQPVVTQCKTFIQICKNCESIHGLNGEHCFLMTNSSHWSAQQIWLLDFLPVKWHFRIVHKIKCNWNVS